MSNKRGPVHRNPKFRDKVEATVKLENQTAPLSKEQEDLIKKALLLALPPKK